MDTHWRREPKPHKHDDSPSSRSEGTYIVRHLLTRDINDIGKLECDRRLTFYGTGDAGEDEDLEQDVGGNH